MRNRAPATVCILALPAFAAADRPFFAENLPPSLYNEFLGLEVWQWISLGVLLLLSPVVGRVVRAIVRGLFKVRYRLTSVKISDEASRGIRRSTALLAAAFLWLLAIPELDLGITLTNRLFFLAEIAAIGACVWLVSSLWDAMCDSITERASHMDRRAEKLLVPVTRKFIRVVILVGGLFALGAALGLDLRGWIAGLGIGGLVIALAAKDSVENVFGSLTILFDMPFALGDWVKIGTVEGIVEEINLRSTRIRTFEDSVITLPNSNLIRASVENFGARRFRRQRFSLRLSYDSQPEAIDAFVSDLRDFLRNDPGVVSDRVTVELNEATEANIGVLVQFFLEAESFEEEMRLRSHVISQILRRAKAAGVRFPVAPLPPLPEAEPKLG